MSLPTFLSFHNESSMLHTILLFSNAYMIICIFKCTYLLLGSSPTMIFIAFNIRFVDRNSLPKINSWTYIMFSTIRTRYQIYNIVTTIWQLTFYEVSHCTPEFILNKQKLFTNPLFITATNSTTTSNTRFRVQRECYHFLFKFLLRLYITENFLWCKTFFKTSFECR